MSKPLAFGLNLSRKPCAAKQKPISFGKKSAFGGDEDSDTEEHSNGAKFVEISGDLDDIATTAPSIDARRVSKQRQGTRTQPPKLNFESKPNAVFGDLSSTLASRRNAEAATELDSTVYEYDSVYDSLKPKKGDVKEDVERKPKYMKSLLQAAEVRKRDALIAEEKKIAREREAEGDEYADKEKFVTEAYKKQQEENRRIEEEEKRREEEEAKKNEGGGMSAFYRKLLDKDEARHTEIVKAVEENAKDGPTKEQDSGEEPDQEKAEADLARKMNEKGASVAVNEDGQVVDKRQLLRGGLNVGAKKKEGAQREAERPKEPERRSMNGAQFGRKQAMRERQTRMMEEQLEQSLKRSREAEEAQREQVERAAKSQKTEGEISSAKERYLARKRAAEEAKQQAGEK
ncbi:hypothetical protein ED733_003160 [Metarhizium rileyi]|nr:hypothetical protein ED733_003160 [Metarhizium rileyi]